MTNEEAKEIMFEQLQSFLPDYMFFGRIAEAYKMAIKALEQQPCEDCISRKEVLDYIDKMPSELTSDGRRMVRRRTLEEYISDTLPSVTPQQTRWIPVSERLPEDYGEYICTMSDDNVQECGFVPSYVKELISGWSTCEANGFKKLDYRDIKAWMPLPQPYKAESEEEE